jgi:ABC-2 type transport system ATP-binding protein
MKEGDMNNLITARNLAKNYGPKQALKNCSFELPPGQILGVIGANGAGKSTLLNALLGLHDYQGELTVLGVDPYKNRANLMQNVCFIADVATLPKWMTVRELLDVTAGMHPNFDRAKAEARLAKTTVPMGGKVRTLSKGMIVQVHLAIVLAINAKLLVLDEPTLGLDILNRRAFYEAILTEYFDETRSIIVTTHQVDEIEQILSHAMIIRDGEMLFYESLDGLADRYRCVDVDQADTIDADALKPIMKRRIMGRSTYVYDGVPDSALSRFGTPRRVSLTDLFIALNAGDAQ